MRLCRVFCNLVFWNKPAESLDLEQGGKKTPDAWAQWARRFVDSSSSVNAFSYCILFANKLSWPAQGALFCGVTVAVALKLALYGSIYHAQRTGVGMGAGASSTSDLGAQQSPLVLGGQRWQAEQSSSGCVCAKVCQEWIDIAFKRKLKHVPE